MILDKYRLDGKVAVVTGGSMGIGLAIATGFAEVGADVILVSRKLPDLEKAAEQIFALGRRAVPIAAHCGKKEEIEGMIAKVLDQFGRIDILVNNAGTNPVYSDAIDVEEWAWDAIMNLNLKGYFLLSQLVAKQWIKQGQGGCIINLSSGAGIRPYAGLGVYSVSKAGVVMLTKVLASELGKHNIRVNAIAPGVVRTKLSKYLVETPEVSKKIIEQTALHRTGQTDDVVGAALLLASDASNYISGHTLVVDGGQTSFGA